MNYPRQNTAGAADIAQIGRRCKYFGLTHAGGAWRPSPVPEAERDDCAGSATHPAFDHRATFGGPGISQMRRRHSDKTMALMNGPNGMCQTPPTIHISRLNA